ncbi:hypothetical protein F751_1994 [Auxenochlorella protothecoides]|uniref:Uncharacterized protein n=1 Tax=Auxenochlorella protothecoides TaxID=3075 RepID=A0A087SHB1_AUXPR|nr:hypothetical protein F751_1994 [Auxenochlorella protothecoides]KFM25115.1 hypothetical protein F751_1994 [Auxenochlorella protothecoides]
MATVHQSKNRSDLDSNELLLERLDKMTTIMAASAQGHYRRTYQAFDIASPGPLAFFSFAIATGMQGLVYTGTLEVQGSQLVLIVGLFIGGFLMFICGFMEFLRRNTFGATMFTLFGAFWFTLTIYNLLLFAGVATFMLTAMPKTVACLAGTLGFITAVMAIVVANLTLAVEISGPFQPEVGIFKLTYYYEHQRNSVNGPPFVPQGSLTTEVETLANAPYAVSVQYTGVDGKTKFYTAFSLSYTNSPPPASP